MEHRFLILFKVPDRDQDIFSRSIATIGRGRCRLFAESDSVLLGHNELFNRCLELVVEESLLLQLRMISQKQIRLTVQDLTCQLCILVEMDDSCREARVDADHSVKSHDWIRSEHKVLTVALL